MAADEPSVITAFFLITSRLIDFDHSTQKYVPALAEAYNTAGDGRTVNVKLRESLKFSDGSEITSDDVVFTLTAIYDERTKSPAWKDAMLVGGKPIEVKAVDKLNFQLIFPEKVASVENYMVNLGVLSSTALKANFEAGNLAETWKIISVPTSIVTSGAFMVEASAVGESVTLSRNPHYWKKDASGSQLPYLDRLVLNVIPDPNNALARLNQNSLDIADRIRAADFAALSSSDGAIKAIDVGPGLGTDHLWFNLNKAKANGEPLDNGPKYSWFSDKRFRQAISMAIDRKSLTTNTFRGLATPLYGFVSPGNRTWADPSLPKTEFSVSAASLLLKDGGFTTRGTEADLELFDSNNNRVEFTLIVPNESEPRKLMAAVIQEDLARLGIKMRVVPVEFQTLTERWSKSLDYDAILLGLSVSDIDPSTYSNFLLSGASSHQWQPNQKKAPFDWEERIDRLFAEQSQQMDAQKRAAIFNQIQNIMADELPVVPIVARHMASATNSRIGNFSPSSLVPYSLWNADQLFIKQ